jgi:FlaA1/EpsC-like NDP-sugar epimerase
MDWIFSRLHCDVVFHTAAFKHVPMSEENPVACIHNNVFGTRNLIDAVRKHGVRRFVHITTDKAVNPVCVYGASKYLCERMVLEAATVPGAGDQATNFMVVRFGNVLGSRGSIMPLFQKQIEQGGPVTVTHPEMRRYFMTIPEAVSLVLEAGGVGDNGSLYLLDMGESLKITDLAEQMIRFYGLEPGKDIKIEFTGCRPGERLDERLWGDDESPVATPWNRILRVERGAPSPLDLAGVLRELEPICRLTDGAADKYRNSALVRSILRRFIPTYAEANQEEVKNG